MRACAFLMSAWGLLFFWLFFVSTFGATEWSWFCSDTSVLRSGPRGCVCVSFACRPYAPRIDGLEWRRFCGARRRGRGGWNWVPINFSLTGARLALRLRRRKRNQQAVGQRSAYAEPAVVSFCFIPSSTGGLQSQRGQEFFVNSMIGEKYF